MKMRVTRVMEVTWVSGLRRVTRVTWVTGVKKVTRAERVKRMMRMKRVRRVTLVLLSDIPVKWVLHHILSEVVSIFVFMWCILNFIPHHFVIIYVLDS